MERLTKLVYGEWKENHDNDQRKGFKNGNRACMERLAMYENTGKTAEELQALVTAEQEGRLVVLLSQNEYTKRLEKLCAENWKVNSLVRDRGKVPEHLEDKALKLMGLKKIVGYANDETQDKIDSQK